MSGHVHRRRTATPALAAALACALVWLGIVAAGTAIPIAQDDHVGPGIAIAQTSAQHVAQRVVARLGHVRAAVISTSQRHLAGLGALRALAIVLSALLGLRAARRGGTGREAARMHGVRAPPAVAERSSLPAGI